MSNKTPPMQANLQTPVQVTVAAQTASNAALAARIRSITASTAASISGRVVSHLAPQLKLWDYAYKPEHPDDWTAVKTRDLEEGELFEVHKWLRLMSNQPYDIITHYTPALSMLVYFQRSQDAAMFKLAWGGE